MAAVKGSKMLYPFRVLSSASSAEGTTLALTTENSRSVSKDAESTVTKDGVTRTPNEAEITISATTMLEEGDEMIDTLEDAMLDDEVIEVWEANIAEEGTPVYELTSDTAIVAGKDYYTRTGTSPNYVYTKVTSPSAQSLSTYYEITAAQYAGRYYQGYITSVEKSSPADGYVEISLEFAVNGEGVKGNVTITAEQEEAAAYAFQDTTIQSAG